MTATPPGDGPIATRTAVAEDYGVFIDAMRRTASDHGWYLHACPELLSLLMQVKLDADIPPPLHQAAAELLAWLYELEHDLAA